MKLLHHTLDCTIYGWHARDKIIITILDVSIHLCVTVCVCMCMSVSAYAHMDVCMHACVYT